MFYIKTNIEIKDFWINGVTGELCWRQNIIGVVKVKDKDNFIELLRTHKEGKK